MTHAKPFPLAIRWAFAGFALVIAIIAGMELNAQGLSRHNTNAPVHYSADRIELQDRQNRVVLSGNVQIEQADLTVRAPRTLVNYNDAGALTIERITATGGVTILRGNETARADVAVYDFGRRIITMAGNVRLNRGSDTLDGARLVIDLDSGIASVDGRASSSRPANTNGRVTGSFAVPRKTKQD